MLADKGLFSIRGGSFPTSLLSALELCMDQMDQTGLGCSSAGSVFAGMQEALGLIPAQHKPSVVMPVLINPEFSK